MVGSLEQASDMGRRSCGLGQYTSATRHFEGIIETGRVKKLPNDGVGESLLARWGSSVVSW